jgi:D-alanine--poly(phosphoribitol) ligase subunit 1
VTPARSYRYNIGLAYRAVLQERASSPALIRPGRTVSHGELDTLANRVAAVFRECGIGRRDVVGIVHTKTDECYAAMLACLKLGAAYVNLDDQNPAARLEHIFAAAVPKLIVGESPPAAVVTAAAAAATRLLDFARPEVLEAIAAASAVEPADLPATTGSDPAYIMFTSGSTGVPKGAVMTHANVLNFAAWVKQRFRVAGEDVFTNVNPMYFDNSVFDFYGAILNGAGLAPVTREVVADAPAMLAQLEEAGATIWFSVPSLLIYLTTLKLLTPERLGSIRTFSFGGEGYPKPELRKLFDMYASRSRIVNVYGPTECTCICSAWDVSGDDLRDPAGLVTLGPVAENFSMVVLDDADQAVGPGGTGELCLLGPQVGLGYVNDPERTARSFTRNPVNPRWEERMYRTGDLVRVGADGRMLDFVGRKDNQIKHMGYRIELEEIEAALHQLDGVSEAAVVHVPGRRDMKILVAFLATGIAYTDAQIRERLAAILPPYMIPQRFELRDVLPKNANGKVDRRALAS